MPEPRRAGRRPSDRINPCSRLEEFRALLRPRGGRRQPGQPRRPWHGGQRTAESSSPGLRNTWGSSTAPGIHPDAQAGAEIKACGLPACPPSTEPPVALRQGGELPCFILPWISPSSIPEPSINGNCPKPFAKLRTVPARRRRGRGAVAGSVPREARSGGGERGARGSRHHRSPVTLLASLGQKLLETSEAATPGSNASTAPTGESPGSAQPAPCSPSPFSPAIPITTTALSAG